MIKKTTNYSSNLIKSGSNEVLGIWDKIRKRDFSGNTGLAIKNTLYQFATSFISKGGSLLFTIIIARMLLPELFGLYSLALSTIVLFSSFADLGIGQTLINFISKESSKKKGNQHGYYNYILKIKVLLTFLAAIILASGAYFISNYYNKPIFLALIAGSFYILSNCLLGFFSNLFQAENNFKPLLKREIMFQALRLILIPLAILITIGYSNQIVLFYIFLALSFSYLVQLIYLYTIRPRYVGRELNKQQKKIVNSFIIILTTTVLSGVFFGYIDVIILGRFVEAQFIGFYQAALTLVASTGALFGFSSVLFPIFNKLSGERLKKGLIKSIRIASLVSLGSILIIFFLGKIAVFLIYGAEYSQSILLLKIMSLLVFIDPLIAIYSAFHISQGRQEFVARYVIFATLLNIALNIALIIWLINYSSYAATIGAGIATIISRGFYLLVLSVKK
jgi:O-antigen/teichoic acid export membrane protein